MKPSAVHEGLLLLLLPAAKAYEFTAASTVPAAYRVWAFITLISSQSLVKQKLFSLECGDNNLFYHTEYDFGLAIHYNFHYLCCLQGVGSAALRPSRLRMVCPNDKETIRFSRVWNE